jgi:selenocysteine lyase/cysteine desulfurase
MIDFFTGGTHKWLMGLQGLGYFYISDELFEKVDVKFVGWTSVKNPWKLIDYNLDLLQNAGKYETGTLPRIAIIALNSSLTFFHEIGSAFIENRILDNSVYLFRKLFDLGCDTVLKDVNRQNMSGIVSIKLKNSEMILRKLEEKRIICSLREGILRISPHFYNTRDELDLLVSEIEENVSN